MAIFQLTKDILFPPPQLADEDGLLAVGGDLSPERLIQAYSKGIFPWYVDSSPILWWSPDPRLVLFPEELRISRSLRQILNKNIFHVTTDKAFEDVIKNCAYIKRKGSFGTWLTKEMIYAYIRLHNLGYSHSVESWYEGQLVGGLYGVVLGGVFFGESMFTKISNASKVAFVKTVNYLKTQGYVIIDCQVVTQHLINMGARTIPRDQFLQILKDSIKKKVPPWGKDFYE
ncbi:MAG: leucyl/phenylalanyl-tRNA--protein transferase [Thermodesulfovibrionales bacterium]|nr:leucyl/phenylalanyl-tRNA--protein transferase [Thermodesulfovibrionales bacterium]